MVIGNAWCSIRVIPLKLTSIIIRRQILHDPTLYPEPDVFKPERFLNQDGSSRDDPTLTSAFGFGKRICPGRYMVDAMLFISVASLLSVFDITKGKDSGPDGYSFTGSFFRYTCLVRRVGRFGEQLLIGFFSVVRIRSLALSLQGIKGQRNLSMPMP
jgi:Cytochrome P450